MARVWVVAASAARRAGLEALVAAHRLLEVVGRSADLATAGRDIAEVRPDAIVIDLDASSAGGLAELRASRGARGAAHSLAVVVLADPQDLAGVAPAVRSGIRALLPPEASAAEIGGAIAAAGAGLVVVHPAFRDVISDLAPDRRYPDEPQGPPLTERELEVLALMAQGLSNKAIAESLGISDHTVKFHIGSIFTKLDVSSRTEAVTEGIRAGLVLL